MNRGRYLLSQPPDRKAWIRRRRLMWAAELIMWNLCLGALWAMGYIHPAPAGVIMAVQSGRLGYRLGRYR